MAYQLYYWPGIPGRGEFVRLVLEHARAEYIDVARLSEDEGGGVPAIQRVLSRTEGTPAFAVPILEDDGLFLSQTANICQYLAERHGGVPEDVAARVHANQLMLTVMDVVFEAHETHHPISTAAYYEDQKDAALQRARAFVESRLPKYLSYFERVLGASDGVHFLAEYDSYVDLAFGHLWRGLEFAFPSAMRRLAPEYPACAKIADRIEALPAIAAYLASDRRIAFNNDGIFRGYPELDV